MKTNRLEDLLSQFQHAKVAVLGDFFLDLYIQMDRSLSEFSLETHKEAFQAVDLRGQPGAAGVVTNNLTALGAASAAVAFTGKDGNGYTLRQSLSARKVNISMMVETKDRMTPTYTKPLMREVDGTLNELNRIDVKNRTPNPSEFNQLIADNVQQAINKYDGILVVEQISQDGYGTMSPLVRKSLAKAAEAHPTKPILVDSRHFAFKYTKVTLKMNLSEALHAAEALKGHPLEIDLAHKVSAAQTCLELFWNVHHKPAFITLGEEGIAGIDQEGFFHHPGFHVQGPIDIVGAGDSVLAGCGLALCCKATPREAAYIGNLVGSITIQQIGTTGIATREDLLHRHFEYQNQINR